VKLKLFKYVFIVSLMFAMLLSAFTNVATVAAYTPPIDKVIILPDYIEGSIAMMYPDASEELLAQVRAQCAEQMAINEKYKAQLDTTFGNGQTRATASLSAVNIEEINGGHVYDAQNIIGTQNLAYTRFLTTGLNQGASVYGSMTNPSAKGTVSIAAKMGPTGAGQSGNYVIVWGSQTGALHGTWDYIGKTQIPTSGPLILYVGYTTTSYPYIAVGTNTMMGGSVTYNDVMVDCITFTW